MKISMQTELAFELLNVAVITEVFTEEEAQHKETTMKELIQDKRRTAKASLDSYIIRNVIAPYIQRVSENN